MIDLHHLKSKGSGGEDHPNNLLELCRMHHTEIHQVGMKAFVQKYPKIEDELRWKGWIYDGFFQKWYRLTDKGWAPSSAEPPCPHCEESSKKCEC